MTNALGPVQWQPPLNGKFTFIPTGMIIAENTTLPEWLQIGEHWKAKYRKVEALNNGYKTVSVAVPTKVLLETLRASTILDMKE